MNAPPPVGQPEVPVDLAVLPAPGRLARAARLYGVVLDRTGNPGPRQFVASLGEGAAVFTLSAPGVCFLLHEQGAPSSLPLVGPGPIDAAALDAWYGALLSAPGLPPAARLPIAATNRPPPVRPAWLALDSVGRPNYIIHIRSIDRIMTKRRLSWPVSLRSSTASPSIRCSS